MSDRQVSEQDRRHMRRLAVSLGEAETDEDVHESTMAAAVMAADADRAAAGRAPLRGDGTSRPEEELYRRARALGFR